jgi:hypothetical protein
MHTARKRGIKKRMVEKRWRKKKFRRIRCEREDDIIKVDLSKIGYECVDCLNWLRIECNGGLLGK